MSKPTISPVVQLLAWIVALVDHGAVLRAALIAAQRAFSADGTHQEMSAAWAQINSAVTNSADFFAPGDADRAVALVHGRRLAAYDNDLAAALVRLEGAWANNHGPMAIRAAIDQVLAVFNAEMAARRAEAPPAEPEAAP